jgi:ABC-type multidrug transport system fused ATPase/permease subunit
MKKKNKKKKNITFFTNIKKTYKYAKQGRKYLFIFLLTNIIQAAISIAIPIITARRIIFLTSGIWQELSLVAIAIFVIEICRNITRYLSSWSYNKYYFDVRRNMQIDLARETLKITQSDLNSKSSGVFIERITNDTDQLSDIFGEMIEYITSIISSTGILISTLFINYTIFIAYVIFIILIFFVNKKFAEINQSYRKDWKKSRERTGGFITEIVRGAKDIKILDAEESFLEKADDYLKETNVISFKYWIVRATNRLFRGNIQDFCDLLISLLLINMLLKGKIMIAAALIIHNYHYQILDLASYFDNIFEVVKSFDLAANRIFGIIDGDEFSKEKFGDNELVKFDGNIEFKNVSFSYDDKVPVLKKMNFKINANETVAFVGSSGAGKSTIFNLISAVNKVKSGTITFDGKNINDLSKHSIRGNLSIISQNPYIYNMSIKDNLKIIKKDATMQEIRDVCRMACLEDFINELPHKYNTIVGEGGVTLSGGQKQRLAIARALLLKTEIILFDEATSALDNVTQAKIQQAINNMKGEYTILIIAHRITTVKNADKIFVIEDGKIVDQGTHKELLKNSKAYQRLYSEELESEN